ncbi:winged helix-turn-helix domain-containing protein [Roseibium sp.]|uniref:winged helix-turn-helix domain-containing tetratricopeptide repeat protein n=2 Tax=Roseibium sp. TaxID=1936156 RepID=UPI0032666ACC
MYILENCDYCAKTKGDIFPRGFRGGSSARFRTTAKRSVRYGGFPRSPIRQVSATRMKKHLLEIAEAPERILFGDVKYFCHSQRLVSANGQETVLRSQSAKVLQLLAGRLGNLVTRDELVQEVWADIAVTDDSLTQCIADIRKALQDRDRVLLRTVPKRGYILNGRVDPEATGSARLPVAAREPETAGAHGATATGAAHPLDRPRASGPTESLLPQLDPKDVLPTLAILPFKAQAGSQDESLGALFANDITTALSLAEDVNIISWFSSSSMGSPTGGLRSAGHQLRADFILSGYVVCRGGRIIVSVEFCETETQFVLWSDRFERQLDSFLQDTDSVHQIVTRIRKAITLNELRRLQSRPLQSLKLFSILQGAVGLMYRLTPREFNQAKTYLEYVSAQVPNHPAPLAWLARWHVLRAVQGWADDPAREASAALHYTGRALDLEPEHGLALVCEGQVLVNLALRLDEAEDRYSAALVSNPNDAQARALRGMLAAFRDRGADAKRDTERALHLAPLDPHRFIFLVQAAGANISVENYARAVTLSKESLRLNRSHSSTIRTLAVAQAGTGDVDSARRTARELLRLQPDIRVSTWLRASPSADYEMGRKVAELMRLAGIPD